MLLGDTIHGRDEFADFVLDMQMKESAPAKGDAVFDASVEEVLRPLL